MVQDVLRTPGHPLDPASKSFFEPRLGADFSQVHIHTDAHAANSARSVNAQAYTVGQHVVFGRGYHAPHTAAGRHLLAHELVHTLQQRGGAAGLQRAPDPKAPPPTDLSSRLQLIEQTGPAIGTELNEIILRGGPMPTTGTKVIGAFIVDVEGYTGPRTIRTINGADTDGLSAGAKVFHAPTPTDRTLTQTQGAITPKGGRTPSITGPRRESINPHINDAEIKGFEYIIPRLPKNARGRIYFTTVRVRVVNGQAQAPEPIPACSGCIRASFETAGEMGNIDLVSHAAVHPTGTADVGNTSTPHADHDEPITNPQKLKPGSVNMSPHDADVDPATGRVVPGPNTTARRTNLAPSGRFTEVGVTIGATAASVALSLLAAHFKAKRDQEILDRQIKALVEVARNKINANPNDAVKMMMRNPDTTVYAWVHLKSAVITTVGTDPQSPEPVLSDSSPLADIGQIEYVTAPWDPAFSGLVDGVPRITAHGSAVITVREIGIVDLPLVTPPLEELIDYAKAHQLPLDDVREYALKKLISQGPESVTAALESRQRLENAHDLNDNTHKFWDDQYKLAEKRKDIHRQAEILEKLIAIDANQNAVNRDLLSSDERIRKARSEREYWHRVVDLVTPPGSRP
jgi:hypothetical protein